MQLSPRVRRSSAILTVVLAASLAAVSSAAARPQTTVPGFTEYIQVILTNTRIDVQKTAFDLKGQPNVSHFLRGALVNFRIVNRGSGPARLRLQMRSGLKVADPKAVARYLHAERVVAAGQTVVLPFNFLFRASYSMDVLRGKKVLRHLVEVGN